MMWKQFDLAGILIVYLLIINIVTFVIYGIDKRAAVKQLSRISEATLLGLALIGGSAGALAGMYTFHHKTKKPRFAIGVPAILALQIILIVIALHNPPMP